MNPVIEKAANKVMVLCEAAGISLDRAVAGDGYIVLRLNESHGIDADFFIRSQGVGFSVKSKDLPLFYLLQAKLKSKKIELQIRHNGKVTTIDPYLPKQGTLSMKNPSPFYVTGISSGNLKGRSDISFNRTDPEALESRSDALAAILFTQWIWKMMPTIEDYKLYRDHDLLANVIAPIRPVKPQGETA